MKRIVFTFFSLCLFANSLCAAPGDQYLLPKFGNMTIDLLGADPLLSVGLLYGYGLNERTALETELNLGVNGGKYDKSITAGSRLKGEYSVATIAQYGVYRFPLSHHLFLKAKAGLIYESITRDGEVITSALASTPDSRKTRGFGIASGIGLGFSYKKSVFEVEYTFMDKDILFLNMGINYVF